MKHILFFVAVLISATRLPAQTNEPIRLAVIPESKETSAAADVLTAQLSRDSRIILLE
jgi:hypothetical protein